MATTKKQPDFEEALARLGAIVSKLEGGDAPLAESLALFEEGTALLAHCEKLLDGAEQQVLCLSKGPDGAPRETPFDEAEA